MNGGAVRPGMNIKIAAELLHSGDHPWDANPRTERIAVPVYEGLVSTLPVIADDQTQSLAHTSEIDGDAPRGGVAIHVGQRLLDNAQQGKLKR